MAITQRVQNKTSLFTSTILCLLFVGPRLGRAEIQEECAVNLLILLIVLLVLFGGGGFYLGGPAIGGSLGGIIILVLIVLLVTGKL
jgi:hypothetical protein